MSNEKSDRSLESYMNEYESAIVVDTSRSTVGRSRASSGSVGSSHITLKSGHTSAHGVNPAPYLVGTDYENEYYLAIQTYNETISLLEEIYPLRGTKYKAALLEAEQQLNKTVSSLITSYREREQSSIARQIQEQQDAGLNPVLQGVDSAAAAGAGAGVTPTDLGQLPDPTSGMDILSTVLDVVSTGANIGLGIANHFMQSGKTAADIAQSSQQTNLMKVAEAAYMMETVEKFVFDNAPQYDESLHAFPAWSVGSSIPALPDHLQSAGMDYAKSFYGSDRHRAGQLQNRSDVESQRSALAHLYGSGFYSDSLGVMSDNVAKYSKMYLDTLDSRYHMEQSYNALYDKYYKLLSPEVMAEVQNNVNTYNSHFYGNLDPVSAAGAANAQNESDVEFLDSYDASSAAGSINSENKFHSVYYDELDAKGKSAYENYYTELENLQLQFVEMDIQANNALFEEVRKDLNSSDPAVRYAAAQKAQRLRARSSVRSSRTGWQRFSDVSSRLGGVVVGAAAVGVGAAKAFGKAASRAITPITTPLSFDGVSDLGTDFYL